MAIPKNGFTVDAREFNQAMDQYLAVSSKDRATVANTKIRDWMFKSFKAAPKATRTDIKSIVEKPEIISWWCNQRFGKGMWGRKEWKLMRKVLRRRLQAIGYVKSGWVKAANKFKPEVGPHPGKQSPPPGSGGLARKFTGSKARVVRATDGERNRAESENTWEYESGGNRLQLIQDNALAEGKRLVTADTKLYIERKLKKIGRKVSV